MGEVVIVEGQLWRRFGVNVCSLQSYCENYEGKKYDQKIGNEWAPATSKYLNIINRNVMQFIINYILLNLCNVEMYNNIIILSIL